MDKAKYWFLNLVVDLYWPLGLMESENLEIHVNGPGHGLNHSDLVATLYQMFQEGSLVALRESREEPREEFTPTRQEIERALEGKDDVYFGVTAFGGARWELESQPNWNRYIYTSISIDPNEGELICADRSLAEAFLSTQPWWPEVEGSKSWEVLTPWQATYWKNLPEGHRVTFLHEEYSEADESRSWEKPEDYLEKMERQKKCCDMQKWYRNPYD